VTSGSHSWNEPAPSKASSKPCRASSRVFLHEKTEGDGRHNYITTAAWEIAEAFENAKIAAAEFKRRGFDPQDATRRWKIEAERAVFARSPC
jgi:hypothetical protein